MEIDLRQGDRTTGVALKKGFHISLKNGFDADGNRIFIAEEGVPMTDEEREALPLEERGYIMVKKK